MTTLAVMKARIAEEFRRDDLTSDIASAITTAITAYKYEKFSFNATTFVDAPASDGEAANAWMVEAERLIRCRAKLELVINVFDQPDDRLRDNLKAEVDDALLVLRRSRTNTTTATADTLGAMKLRIKNEINRSDLDTQIANAINDAVKAYEDKRFFFNETRSFTFSTVASQPRYTSGDDVDIGKILKIDYVPVEISGTTYICEPRLPIFFEHDLTSSDNIPFYYGWYDESLILYPAPADVYTIRVGCVEKIAAPASDTEVSNPWMTHAERLIRNRAKAELYTHVDDIADDGKASKFMMLAEEALEQLDMRTTRMSKTGPAYVEAFN